MESTLKKGSAEFNLIGEAKLNDFTFKINEDAKNSDWIYSVMRLGVDCGDSGDIYCELMGGYGSERENVLYVHGVKEEDGKTKDDWSNQYKVSWEDRFDEDVLSQVGNQCFITVGIEKDSKGKTYQKKFLSEYDAIEYIKEHLENGMVLNVRGDIEYSMYNDYPQAKKKVTSIYLSHADSRDKYTAKFTQTILVDKDSVGNIDKDKNAYPIDAYVVEYINKPMIDGKKIEVKENLAIEKTFELKIVDAEKTEKLVKKLFKPTSSKALYEITVEGIISKGANASVELTIDDLPEDIKELVELDVFTLEEALEKCVGKQSSIESWIITNPRIIMRGEGEDRTPVIMFDKEKYRADELITYAQGLAKFVDDEPVKPTKTNNKPTKKAEAEEEEEFDMDALLEGIE